MTTLKLWYAKLNPTQKNEFREKVMKNECGLKVGLSSFFNYMETQHAPEPLQKEIAKITKDFAGKYTGVAEVLKADLYKGV